jgi:hypothetical protein
MGMHPWWEGAKLHEFVDAARVPCPVGDTCPMGRSRRSWTAADEAPPGGATAATAPHSSTARLRYLLDHAHRSREGCVATEGDS